MILEIEYLDGRKTEIETDFVCGGQLVLACYVGESTDNGHSESIHLAEVKTWSVKEK